jgi:hypothetical protein
VATGSRILPKDESEALADRLVEWFGDVLDYFNPVRWAFRVNDKGVYLPGEVDRKTPSAFQFRHVRRDGGRFEFRIEPLSKSERIPHTRHEINHRRDEVHKCVSRVLINLVDTRKTNKLLEDLRKKHDLKKLRQPDAGLDARV